MDSVISRVDISQTLSKIREISEQTKVFGESKKIGAQTSPFNQVFSQIKHSLADASLVENQAREMQTGYLSGDKQIAISDVMLSTMKSKLAFEGLLVVRNKLLEAYKEIMNMPV